MAEEDVQTSAALYTDHPSIYHKTNYVLEHNFCSKIFLPLLKHSAGYSCSNLDVLVTFL